MGSCVSLPEKTIVPVKVEPEVILKREEIFEPVPKVVDPDPDPEEDDEEEDIDIILSFRITCMLLLIFLAIFIYLTLKV